MKKWIVFGSECLILGVCFGGCAGGCFQGASKPDARTSPNYISQPLVSAVKTSPVGSLVDPTGAVVESLIGRWEHPWTENAYLEFCKDGTFKQIGLLVSTEGKYRLLTETAMEWEIPGVLYGKSVGKVKFKLDGDTLELGGCSWKRLK